MPRPKRSNQNRSKPKRLGNRPRINRQPRSVVTVVDNRPIQQRVVRYYATTTTEININRLSMLHMFVSTRTASTTASSVFESVKLEMIRIVLMADDSANGGGLTLTWTGDRGPDTTETIYGGVGVPAVLTARPPEGTLAGFWSTLGSEESEQLFRIDMTESAFTAFIDLHIQYVVGNGPTSDITLNAPASWNGISAILMPAGSTAMAPLGIFGLQTA